MSTSNEDTVSATYKYSWSSDSDLPLKDYLAKFRPSMVQNDGTKPWIWVRGKEPNNPESDGAQVARELEAVEAGAKLLQEITAQVESIKNDSSIPVRSNKKTGAKSKKEVREQVQAEAAAKLKEISQNSGYVCGKWLMFAPADKVDMIWSSLATSLVEGPLTNTSAYRAKVATTPETENPNYQHVICLYFPDVYDKDTVTEIMKTLLRNHGFNLSGVKSDLYTMLGIDSKHPSGIQSTIWKNKDLMKEEEMKELKDAFFADLKAGKLGVIESKAAEGKASEATKGQDAAPAASKPKLKLKKKQDDPFASDGEGHADSEEKMRKEEVSKQKKLTNKRANDEDEDEKDERLKKRTAVRS